MKDESVIEPFAAPEIYCDGFTNYTVRNGNVSCVGYRVLEQEDGPPQKIAVIRLIFPRENMQAAIDEAQLAVSVARPETRLWLRKAH